MERKGKGRDLTRYFEVLDSGSSSKSNPSTHESVNVSAHATHQDQVTSTEVEHENLMQTEQVEEQTTNSVEAIVEENVELPGVEDHIISVGDTHQHTFNDVRHTIGTKIQTWELLLLLGETSPMPHIPNQGTELNKDRSLPHRLKDHQG